MTEFVKGPWKHFNFKFIEECDINQILKVLKECYFREERINQLLGYTKDYADDLDKEYTYILTDFRHFSFVVVDQRNGNIAGVQLIIVRTRHEDGHFENNYPKFKSREIEILENIEMLCNEGADIFTCYSNLDIVARIDTSLVVPEYRGLGLATEMYRRSIPFLKASGFRVAEAHFTSPYSRRIADRFGFEERFVLHLSKLDFIREENGDGDGEEELRKTTLVFQNATKDDFIRHMCLRL